MPITPDLVLLVTDKVGRFNTDILLGWEAGLLGKERIGRRLFARSAPAHLTGERLADWQAGHDGAQEYKRRLGWFTFFRAKGPDGDISIVRTGWVSRPSVVTQMERSGGAGDVQVTYVENGTVIRSVTCGI